VTIVEPGAFRTDFAGRSLHQARANIADYATTARPRRKENDKTHGTQPGDPRSAAHALIKVVESPTLPARLLLGSDAVTIVAGELETPREEIEAWRDVSTSTDFTAGE
jgi:hypothetical protein